MAVHVLLERVGRGDALAAGVGADEAGEGHEDVKRHEEREQRHRHHLAGGGYLADAVNKLGHGDLAPHEPQRAPHEEEAYGNPLGEVVGQVQVAPRLGAHEVLHGPTGELLEAAAQDHGKREDHVPGALAQRPEHGGEQARADAVQRRERPPHQAHAAFQHAELDEHPHFLEDEPQHRGGEEDDDVLVEAGAVVVEEVLAHLGFGALDGLLLLLGDLCAQVLAAEALDLVPLGALVDLGVQAALGEGALEALAGAARIVVARNDVDAQPHGEKHGEDEKEDL